MKAAVLREIGKPVTIEEVATPSPGAGEVLIRVEACGVCHSDLHLADGDWDLLRPITKVPLILGHEVAGTVAALGEGVTQLKVGDRVGVPWIFWTCGECEFCREERETLCVKQKITGCTVDGGFAEYLVAPATHAAWLPASLSAVEAAPLMCAGITTYNALRNSGARAGDTVAVQGSGGLGHLGIQFAAKMGFRTVAVSSGSDKEELARQLGAHEYVDTNKVSAGEGLQKLGGADYVLATAPHEPLTVSPFGLLSGKTIAGWPSGGPIDSEETVAFAKLAGIKARIETFSFDRAEEAFAKVMQNKVRFRAVLVP